MDDTESRARIKLAEIFGSVSGNTTTETLCALIRDADDEVRAAALKGDSGRPALLEGQKNSLAADSDWTVRFAVASALGVDRVERERRLAAAAQAGNNHQLVARDFEREIL